MTAWVTALVPLVVALVSAARWPTLGRRIKDHAALAKDLPPEAAKELHALLVDEVRRLAERDRRRLDRRVDRLLNVRRAALTVIAVAVIILIWWSVAAGLKQSPLGWDTVVGVLNVVAAISAGVALIGATWGLGERKRMRRRAARLSEERPPGE